MKDLIFKARFVEKYDVAEYLCSKLLIEGYSFEVTLSYDDQEDKVVYIKSIRDLWQLLIDEDPCEMVARFGSQEGHAVVYSLYIVKFSPVESLNSIFGEINFDIFYVYDKD